MSMIAPPRPDSATTAVPTPPDQGWQATEDIAALRRSLQRLVEEFESDRIELIATHGVIPGAAYDAGVRTAVHEALDDLETGRYGDCLTCEAPIDIDRLRRVPYARRCAPCQRVEERRWNQTERMVASVVRARVGEPQGRSPLTKGGCDHLLPPARHRRG